MFKKWGKFLKVAVLGVALSSASFAGSINAHADTTQAKAVISGKAGILVEQTLSSEDIKKFRSIKLPDGWEIHGNTVTRFYPASKESIESNSSSNVTIDSDGNYQIVQNANKEETIGFSRGNYKLEKKATSAKGETKKEDLFTK